MDSVNLKNISQVCNSQYAYTSETEVNHSIIKSPKINNKPAFLMVKNGLTIAQSIKDRVKQQDNTATTSELIVVSQTIVQDTFDVKLDDKIREELYLHGNSHWLDYTRKDNKFNEWSWVKVDDLLEECNIDFNSEMLHHSEFIKLLDRRISFDKQEAINTILNGADITCVLNEMQEEVVNTMLEEHHKTYVLDLVQRFGKTPTTLEYVKRAISKYNEDLIVVVLAKSKGSDNSFIIDHKKFGYKFKIVVASLFAPSMDKNIKHIKKISNGNKVVYITDEADYASHTPDSIQKMKELKSHFTEFTHIIMSGTGIWKAKKITLNLELDDVKNIRVSEIDRIQAFKDGKTDKVVIPNFFDIRIPQMKEDEKRLNSWKSSESQSAINEMMPYLDRACDGNSLIRTASDKNKCTMLFYNTPTSKALENIANTFKQNYSNKYNVILLIGSTNDENEENEATSNLKAQRTVLTEINSMKVKQDTRKVVIFSNKIGRRSFSIPQIDRVIEIKDNCITDQSLQGFSRGGTWTPGKSFYEIFRISFSDLELENTVLLDEYLQRTIKDIDDDKSSLKLLKTAFNFLNFSTHKIDSDFTEEAEYIINEGKTNLNITEYLNKLQNYNNTANNTFLQLKCIEDLAISFSVSKSKKALKSVTSATKNKSKKTRKNAHGDEIDRTSKDNKIIQFYSELLVLLPNVCLKYFETLDIDEVLKKKNANKWNDLIEINRENFINNMKNVKFKRMIKKIFKNTSDDIIDVETNIEIFNTLVQEIN